MKYICGELETKNSNGKRGDREKSRIIIQKTERSSICKLTVCLFLHSNLLVRQMQTLHTYSNIGFNEKYQIKIESTRSTQCAQQQYENEQSKKKKEQQK